MAIHVVIEDPCEKLRIDELTQTGLSAETLPRRTVDADPCMERL